MKNKKIYLIFLLFIFLVVVVIAHPNGRNKEIVKALDSMENKDYITAVKYIKPLLNIDPEAQFLYGGFYENGVGGLEQNDKLAVYWYKRAANKNYSIAQLFLGDMYVSGKGVEHSLKKAVMWYEKASLNGNKEANRKLQKIKVTLDKQKQNFKKYNEDKDLEITTTKNGKITNIKSIKDFVSADVSIYKGKNRLKTFDKEKYDKLVEEQKYIEVVRDIRSNDVISQDVKNWIEEKAEEGHIPLQFEISNYYLKTDIKSSLKWFFIAYFGAIIDAALNFDKSVNAAPKALLFKYRDIVNLSKNHPELVNYYIRNALEWHRKHNKRPSPIWISYHGLNRMMNDSTVSILIPETEWGKKRKEILDQFEKTLNKTN